MFTQLKIKKKGLQHILLFSILVLSFSSCNTWIGAPYTSPSKMVEVKIGMSMKEVNTALGVSPYDVHHMQDDVNSLLTYKYRKQFRRKIVNSENQLHNEESQTSGKLWYKEPSDLYVFFKDNKMTSLITDAGVKDSEALLIDNNAIQAISKENINLYMLAKNEGVKDTTFAYDIRAIKINNKLTLYKIIRIEKDASIKIIQKTNLNTGIIRNTRTLPSYSSPTINRNYNNSISFGGFANVLGVGYERIIIRTGRFKFGAGLGVGFDFFGVGVAVPFYGFAAMSLDKKHQSSLELSSGGAFVLGYRSYVQGVPITLGYRYEHKKLFFRAGVGLGVYFGQYAFIVGNLAVGFRF